MNRIKNYFITQASRPGMDITFDFLVLGSLTACVYFGFIH